MMLLKSLRFDRRFDWPLLFLLAVGLRLGAAVFTGGLTRPELFEYDDMARNLLAGNGLTIRHLGVTYHSYAPPLLSWISAANYWLFGSIVPTMLVLIMAGAALAVAAAAIAQRLFADRFAALAAGVLVAVHPGLIVYSATKSHPLPLDALGFCLALLLFFRLYEAPTMRRAVTLGLIIGIGTLSRSTTLIFLPIGAVWLTALTWRHDWRHTARMVAVASLVAFVVLLPWSIRDAMVHQRSVFLISTTGEDFWDGNNPNATGHHYVDANRTLLDSLSPAERADLKRQPDELAQSQWFMDRAFAFIKENPARFVRLTFVKFFRFWWFSPQTGVTYPAVWRDWYLAYYSAVLILAGAGVWTLVRRRASASASASAAAPAVLVGLFLLGLSAVQAIYYVEARHRWAIEPMLLSISGGGVAALLGQIRRLRSTRHP